MAHTTGAIILVTNEDDPRERGLAELNSGRLLLREAMVRLETARQLLGEDGEGLREHIVTIAGLHQELLVLLHQVALGVDVIVQRG